METETDRDDDASVNTNANANAGEDMGVWDWVDGMAWSDREGGT